MVRESTAVERLAVSFPIVAAILLFLAFVIPTSLAAAKSDQSGSQS